ncbi:MAG: isoprenylcysteine carboxylmethyltransferase family protein, partial [Nitrolancea sp.]
LVTHPALLLRRLRSGPFAERELSQRVIVSLLQVNILAICMLSALDYASGWSHVPFLIVLCGDVFVAGGLLLIWLVFRFNPFAAATIRVETDQPVISTGPYAVVRHPFYSGLLLVFVGIPPAVGSWLGLLPCLPLLGILIWRLVKEESYLIGHLAGYEEYRSRVNYRLVPRVW